MKTLFIAWQDPETRYWIPVGRLSRVKGMYEFRYTRGAQKSKNFEPFGWMRDLKSRYLSTSLFPLFANRILPRSRPEYRDYLRWLGLDDKEYDELDVLARSGGVRATDTLEIFPCPEPEKDGSYIGYFFSHGLRHLAENERARVKRLQIGQPLFLMQDLQNSFDPAALVLRTEAPISLVGYCPRYYSAEYTDLLKRVGPKAIRINVEQVSPDAPSELALLCKLTSRWPYGYQPCRTGLFAVIEKSKNRKKSTSLPKHSSRNRLERNGKKRASAA